MAYFGKHTVNVYRNVFKVVLLSFSFSTDYVPTTNVVKVTTTRTYQYTNPVTKHAILRNPVFSASHVINYPAPLVATSNSSSSLHVCNVPVPRTLLYHVCKVFLLIALSADLAIISRLHALIKKFHHF